MEMMQRKPRKGMRMRREMPQPMPMVKPKERKPFRAVRSKE